MASDLEQLKAELTDALIRRPVCLHQSESATRTDCVGCELKAVMPIISAALSSVRLQGVREGREQAAEAIRERWRFSEAEFQDSPARHMLTYEYAVTLARGSRVVQPATEQETT